MDLRQISELLQIGSAKKVKVLVEQALAENMNPKQILQEGLLDGMSIIGEKFKKNEVFVPEVLVAARAMNAGISILEPALIKEGAKPLGTIVIGTIHGDLHDIGKNLVTMMMKGAGFKVIDLGIDIHPQKFVDMAEEVNADIICVSALLTTTMGNMKGVIDELNKRGLRDKYVVMVGGAPVTDTFAKQIGADIYTPDAATAAEEARSVVA